MTEPHPLRGEHGRPHPVLEVIGAYGSACWTRCRACGRWFWLETDTSKFMFEKEWELDAAHAELALLGGRPDEVITFLREYVLPEGPLWELASARVELLATLTPDATHSERITALEAIELDSGWSDALAQMRVTERARRRTTAVPPLEFAIDLRADFSGWYGFGEIAGAVFLHRDKPPYSILRITSEQIVQIPVAGPCSGGIRCGDAVVYFVEGADADGLIRFGVDAMIPLELRPRGRRFLAALGDGHLLVVPMAIGGGERTVQILDAGLGFVASFSILLPHHESDPSPPLRLPDGWLASGVRGQSPGSLALVRFDDRFEVVALSEDEFGPRHSLTALGDDRFLARPEGAAFAWELWEQRGTRLERTHELEARGARAFADVFVALSRRGEVMGHERDGTVRWRAPFEAPGATYLHAIGGHVLVYGGHRARLIRATDGAAVHDFVEPFPVTLVADHAGEGYLLAGPSVVHVAKSGAVRRTELDRAYAYATAIDDAVVLADREEAGRYVVVSAEGGLTEFIAPGARFSVITTRGGPYVLEPDRLRIGALPR